MFINTRGVALLLLGVCCHYLSHLVPFRKYLRTGGSFRVVNLVNGQLESIVQHPGKQHLEEFRTFFEARVGIRLDKPRVEVAVDDEVIAKQFEAVGVPFVAADLHLDGHERGERHVFDLLQDLVVEKGFIFASSHFDVRFEFAETQLISIFELTVSGRVLLHGVVGQVDQVVVQGLCLRGVLGGAGSDVPLLEEEAVQVLVNEHPYTDVELPSFDQQRVFNILLNDELVAVDLVSAAANYRLGLFVGQEHCRLGNATLQRDLGLGNGSDLLDLLGDNLFAEVVLLHQFLALLYRIDDMDSLTSVQSDWLQDPQIFASLQDPRFVLELPDVMAEGHLDLEIWVVHAEGLHQLDAIAGALGVIRVVLVGIVWVFLNQVFHHLGLAFLVL